LTSPLAYKGTDGVHGVIASQSGVLDTTNPETEILLTTGQTLRVPTNRLTRNSDGSYSLLEQVTIPVLEEVLDVGKRVIPTGAVRLHKKTFEREETVDVPLYSETFDVQHVPLDRVIDAPVPIRQEGDTIIYPVIEEVLVVTKQLILREEVRVTRRVSERHHQERVQLHREEITVDRVVYEKPDTKAQQPEPES
jgi:uncharacterized protein (TIGR02271 family)